MQEVNIKNKKGERMKKILIISSLTLSMLISSDISGVSYFEFEDSFSLNRTYFTYKKDVSDDVSFKLQTDVGRLDSGVSDDRWAVYLKKAHLDWKVSQDTKISMGMIGLNMLNIQEKTWGNRFISKSALDYYGYSATADLGVAIYHKFGEVSTSFLMTNGEGYKESDVDDENKLSVRVMMGEKKLNKNSGHNIGLVYSSLEDVTVTGFFGGWSSQSLVVGAEYSIEDNDGVENSLSSVYLNYNLMDNLSAFVRVDDGEENKSGLGEERTLVGMIWSPVQGLDISLNQINYDLSDGTSDDALKFTFQFKF